MDHAVNTNITPMFRQYPYKNVTVQRPIAVKATVKLGDRINTSSFKTDL
jgi:hypothetical protein